VARLTWWTRHDKPSETDVLEEARDEEIEMQEIPEEEEEEEAAEKDEKAATEDTPAVDTKPHGHKPRSRLKRFYSWFCGYEAGTEEAKKAAHDQHERLAHITSLERNPVAETFLNINVFVILAVGLYLYIFFSI